jgi:hypothetical protein
MLVRASDRNKSVWNGCALGWCFFVLAACDSHAKIKVEARGNDCVSCHADDVTRTKQPPHALVRFDAQCSACHDEAAWSPAPDFDHARAFPLTFSHDEPACSDCHESGYAQEDIQRECVDCHGAIAEQVVDPVHAGLTTDCFACHRTDAFLPARFVHSWPLTGVHESTECRACHTDNPATYEGTSTLCVTCHRSDRVRVDAVSVEHAGYPDSCQGCHGADTWLVP